MEINLTQGKVAIIDDEDEHIVSPHSWHISSFKTNDSRIYYAVTAIYSTSEKVKHIRMHRLVMRAKPSEVIDHINGNTLDNRKSNLRRCTKAENCRNRKHPNAMIVRKKTSRFKGVMWEKRYKHWYVLIGVNWRQKYIGSFHNEEDAARAYDVAAKTLHGKFASLNFPEGVLLRS